MKNLYNKFKSGFLALLFIASLSSLGFSQVGINNPNPDSSAALDIRANDKGLLIPRLTTVDRTNLPKPAHALLVFDKTQKMFYVYDSIAVKWKALNPLYADSLTGDIITSTSGNFGIGTPTPIAKLDVNGNINSSGNATVSGTVTAGAVTTSGNINSASISTGNINSTATVTAVKFVGEGVVPKGGVIFYTGSVAAIPQGWALCDGTNGTPNLKGMFIAGYDPNDPDYNSIGKKGGEKRHTLSIAEMPSHNHNNGNFNIILQLCSSNPGNNTINSADYTPYEPDIIDSASMTVQGGNQPHENRPPYYTLAYIMKL
jgi:microcystin-dependent protein